MGKITRFEELIAWQKARLLTRDIYRIAQRGKFSRDHGLAVQITRASVSVMSNIAEGFERGGRGEFEHFLSIAKGSCAEIRYQLYVALDAGYIDDGAFNALISQAEELGRIIGGLRASVTRQRRSV